MAEAAFAPIDAILSRRTASPTDQEAGHTIRPTLSRVTLAALGLAAVLQLARITLGPERGLRAEYYSSDQGLNLPVITKIDDNASTLAIADAWRGAAPPTFRGRWYGYLTVARSGIYSFATTSDDSSLLTVDGQRVVDNSGPHGSLTATGTVQLEPGPHFVLIEFAQMGGAYELAWSWARDGGRLTPIPGWVLTPSRESVSKVLIARGFDLLAIAFLVLAALATILLAWKRAWPTRHPILASLVFFSAIAVVHTWPLASDPAHLTRHDNRDSLLNEWIIAWVAHQAPRDPLHLFDANVFYPEHDTLAYSEAMILQSAMGAPLLWLGASPVLTYGLLLLAGFALTGWSMSLVVHRWTGHWTAGLVSGLVFGFSAHTLTRLPHLQAQHAEFLPVVLLALDEVLSRATSRAAVVLAMSFVLQSLASVYLLVFTLFACVAGVVARVAELNRAQLTPVVGKLALAGVSAAVVLIPFLLPYWHANSQGLTRGLAEATHFAATWKDYLSTPSNFHYPLWSKRFFDGSGSALFPGALGLALSILTLARGVAFRDGRARMCLVIGLVGVVLSFGPKVPGYALLYSAVPLLRGIRATARFGYLATFGVAVLAGFGVVIVRAWTPPRAWPVVAAALITIAGIEQLAAPIGYRRFDGIAPIYRYLAQTVGTVAVEIPFFGPQGAQHHATYMLNSTAHWRPILNGYSGFQPASFHRNAETLGDFPDERSIAKLREIGVTHVFVHIDELSAAALDRLAATMDLEPVETFGSIQLFRLTR